MSKLSDIGFKGSKNTPPMSLRMVDINTGECRCDLVIVSSIFGSGSKRIYTLVYQEQTRNNITRTEIAQ